MTWVAILLKYRKYIGYLLVIAILLGVFLAYRHSLIVEGENRVKRADAAAVLKQKAEDEKVLKAANDAHAKELQALKDDIASRPVPPVRLCLSSNTLPKTSVPNGQRPSRGDVPQVPPGDSGLRPEQGPDIGGLLDLLAQRADKLSADSRELNDATHPH